MTAPLDRGLRRELEARIHDVLRTASVSPDEVYVGWVAAREVATCTLRYRLGGEDGWGFPGWSPALAGGAVGRAALLRHVRVNTPSLALDTPTRTSPPLPQPIAAVRDWMREMGQGHAPTSVAEWVAGLAQSNERATLAATAATASRWLAGFVRVLGWPLPDGLAVVSDDPDDPMGRRWQRTYRLRDAGCRDSRGGMVAIGSGPDAVLGRVTPAGGYGVLVHRPTSPSDAAAADRAAFEAMGATLVTGVVPAYVVVTAGDSGEKLRIRVDDPLLARAGDLIVEVVRQRVIATGEDAHDEADATPSVACHDCPGLDRCQTGRAWVRGPGRWRGGLPWLPRSELPDGTMPTTELPVG